MTEPPRREPYVMTAQTILPLIAVILFILAGVGVAFGPIALLPLGLAFGFGSFLV